MVAAVSDRRSQAAVLFLVGAMALYLGGSDAALAYVKAGLQPLLLECARTFDVDPAQAGRLDDLDPRLRALGLDLSGRAAAATERAPGQARHSRD